MRKLVTFFFVLVLAFPIFAERNVGAGNSYSEFPFIIFVGQVVEVTPFSVTFENTAYGTGTNNERIKQLFAQLNSEPDFRSHGMANALRAASIKNGKMRLTFYLDNILQIFDDNVTTYMKYIPLYYLFRNNIKELNLPEKTIESLKKHSIDYYLSIPMAQELMQNSWLAGVFMVNPENDKLTYKSARFFDNLEELNITEWAQSYRIPDIVKAGLAVTMTKAIYIGNESKDGSLDEYHLKEKLKRKGKNGGRNKFDNRQNAPVGTER